MGDRFLLSEVEYDKFVQSKYQQLMYSDKMSYTTEHKHNHVILTVQEGIDLDFNEDIFIPFCNSLIQGVSAEMSGLPETVEGVAYWANVTIPKDPFQTGRAKYELNLAVTDDVFQKFADAGYVGTFAAGSRKYTPDPVINFSKFELSKDGRPNAIPKLYDSDGETQVDMSVGNGSRVKVKWFHTAYNGPRGTIKRAGLGSVTVLDLVEYNQDDGGDDF